MSRAPTPKPAVTHAQLVEVAARWLRRSRGCAVVLTELVTSLAEIPDAIGWYGWWSILIECKTSRSDFRRDADKPHRGVLSDQSVGQERYYLAPKGILKAEDMPQDWGLIEWDGKRATCVVNLRERRKTRKEARSAREIPLLVSALRRHQGGGINAATIALASLGAGDLAIARRVLERRERALTGMLEDEGEGFGVEPPELVELPAPSSPWASLLQR